jgi:hypothetical protein
VRLREFYYISRPGSTLISLADPISAFLKWERHAPPETIALFQSAVLEAVLLSRHVTRMS